MHLKSKQDEKELAGVVLMEYVMTSPLTLVIELNIPECQHQTEIRNKLLLS